MAQPYNYANNMCFEILGFDFMINSADEVKLLEVNHSPSFTTSTPLDSLVKNNLVRDTLKIMNINRTERDKTMNQVKKQLQKRIFTGRRPKLAPDERKQRV